VTAGGRVPAMLLRGGTSKGLYLLADDVPPEPAARDELLRRLMGSPNARQIDGIGGAHPLTSKVAIVSTSPATDVDVDYLFLQVGVENGVISDRQTCGNLLAGVGPFAVERGLVRPAGERASVRIRLVNTGAVAVASFPLEPDGSPRYTGDTRISGVPGSAARIDLDFPRPATGGAPVLPTGNLVDEFAGVAATCVDNGMPVVVLRAADLGVRGDEPCEVLEADAGLRERLEAVRLEAGRAMGLGDVATTTVPKLTLLAPAQAGGTVLTRTFLPHRCHTAIGVLGAVSVATACRLAGTVADGIARPADDEHDVVLEHPTGTFTATVVMRIDGGGHPMVERAGVVRTARKLMEGMVFPRPD
jgi:4-oxalomesaconate tautomerase